jgi:hypothetical protein
MRSCGYGVGDIRGGKRATSNNPPSHVGTTKGCPEPRVTKNVGHGQELENGTPVQSDFRPYRLGAGGPRKV